jgi:hypothetical protein
MTIIFDWVQPKRSGNDSSSYECLSVKQVKSGTNKDGTSRLGLAIIIPEKMMKKARIVVGDRSVIGFGVDPEKGRCVAVRRVVSGGYVVAPASGTKGTGGADKIKGDSVRARVQTTETPDGAPKGFSSQYGGFEVMDDGTLLAWEGLNGQQ